MPFDGARPGQSLLEDLCAVPGGAYARPTGRFDPDTQVWVRPIGDSVPPPKTGDDE